MSEELWSLERVREETKNGIRRLLTKDDASALTEDIDVSYITQELLDAYRRDVTDKDRSNCGESGVTQNVACYWGNNWAHISANKWAYTNNHTGTGCDPITESCLCGSGKRWNATVSQMSKRTCPNGAANAYMAWP